MAGGRYEEAADGGALPVLTLLHRAVLHLEAGTAKSGYIAILIYIFSANSDPSGGFVWIQKLLEEETIPSDKAVSIGLQ